MKAKTMPMVRVFKVYSVTQPPAPEVVTVLLENGFEFEVVSSSRNGKATKVKVGKVRRRRSRRRHPLTAERIREFRKAREDGKSYRRIGQIFGVSDARAWQIVNQGK